MRVLLVQDDPGVVFFLKGVLMKQKHEVVSVNSGQAAARTCKEVPFDLVVLEADLVRENGFEICRMMRRQQITTPILLMTQDNLPGNLAKMVEVGASDHLLKPFTFDQLNKKIRKIVGPQQTVPLSKAHLSTLHQTAV